LTVPESVASLRLVTNDTVPPKDPMESNVAATDDLEAVRRFAAKDSFAAHLGNPFLQARNRVLIEMIPQGARALLDVGCGPGVAGHALTEAGHAVVSLDASPVALTSGPPNGVCGSAGALPVPESAVDLLLSLELLEHLPGESLAPIAKEFQRVARRWILLGVPHRENLARNVQRCPSCAHRFNRSGHRNRFDLDRLRGLFPELRVVETRIIGPPVRDYPQTLLWLRHNVARRFSEMAGQGGVRCPRCGESEFPRFRHNLLSFGLDGLNRLISRRRPYWLLVLFEK